MWDVQVAELARRQFNRISRQAVALPRCTDAAIQHRLDARPLVLVEQGVFGIAPLLGHDDWGRWTGATLTAPVQRSQPPESRRGPGTAVAPAPTRIAGEEADLSWPASRLIIEVDGGPFHLDVGEDARNSGFGRQRDGPFGGFPPTTCTSAPPSCSRSHLPNIPRYPL